jgi:hypothetical protein
MSEVCYASLGARVGKHDDLVLALACWFLAGRPGVGVTQEELRI